MRTCLRTVLVSAAALTAVCASAQAPAQQGGEVMFVSGVAQRVAADGRASAVAKGMLLAEGDRVKTGPDSHVYVRMRDGGLLVVRPASDLHVDLWRYDPAQPQDSRIKYTLDSGVARHVSGAGAKAARDKFRFNTPMAAIGVRGTDFTVLADPAVTRVSVQSGGVVVSGLGNGCRAEGLGPCEGPSAVELFASAKDKQLQRRMGERRPEVVDDPSGTPDRARPAAPGEPTAKKGANAVGVAESRALELEKRPEAPKPVDPPFAAWGRWAAVGDLPAGANAADLLAGRDLVAINRNYILAAERTASPIELPGAGAVNFKLAGHEGVVHDTQTGRAQASTASNGVLNVDFASRRFETSMDIKAGDVTGSIGAKGSVESNGRFQSDAFVSQGIIQGLLNGKGSDAVYLYQRALNDRYEASGVANWRK